MKRKRNTSLNYGKNRIKRPSAVWFIVFGVLLLLFAAFIYFGIKAGEYVENSRSADTDSYITEVNT